MKDTNDTTTGEYEWFKHYKDDSVWYLFVAGRNTGIFVAGCDDSGEHFKSLSNASTFVVGHVPSETEIAIVQHLDEAKRLAESYYSHQTSSTNKGGILWHKLHPKHILGIILGVACVGLSIHGLIRAPYSNDPSWAIFIVFMAVMSLAIVCFLFILIRRDITR